MRALRTISRLLPLLMVLAAAPAQGQSAHLALAAATTPALATNAAETPKLVKAPPGFIQSCARYAWLCQNQPAPAVRLDESTLLDLARAVNSRVNHTITPMTDAENYGVAEYWTLPSNGRGDCEDVALEKYHELLEAGVDGRDLRIAVVLDGHRNNHVVLVLRDQDRDLVLDSLTSRILPWNRTDYTFLAMQMGDDKAAWEIVYQRSRDSNMLASR